MRTLRHIGGLGAALALATVVVAAAAQLPWEDKPKFELADETTYLEAMVAASLAIKRGDVEGAYNTYLPLAERGHSEAQYNVGYMVSNGRGVEKDLSAAAIWYRRAADQNHEIAQLRLGLMLRDGDGVEKDLVGAHMWLSLAAAQGHVEAKLTRAEVAEGLSAGEITRSEALLSDWLEEHKEVE